MKPAAASILGSSPLARGLLEQVAAAGGTGGSSPLARGLRRRRRLTYSTRRIIPARAGFTPTRRSPCRRSLDHPRSRGVYILCSASLSGLWGSSPLARGLPVGNAAQGFEEGIIPARAGFTAAPWPPWPGRWDHPRSRGVYCSAVSAGGRGRGSSPLARGLRVGWVDLAVYAGIIPARAGFTPSCATWSGWPPDHPRSRGVYIDPYTEGSLVAGSSPLARGLPESGGHAQRGVGIIPARAGFTD